MNGSRLPPIYKSFMLPKGNHNNCHMGKPSIWQYDINEKVLKIWSDISSLPYLNFLNNIFVANTYLSFR